MTALRIIRAAEQMIFSDADFIDKPLAQIFAEAGRVRFGQAHVLVEVEHFDTAPIMPGAAVSASRNSNCDAPVAAMMRAWPRAAIASRIMVAARAAAAAASDFLSENFLRIKQLLISLEDVMKNGHEFNNS